MGFPTLKKLMAAFKDNDQVVFLAVQTVFEGYRINTRDKLRSNQLKYGLEIPMAHASGNPETRESPAVMQAYRAGGTPWKVIIDPAGKVVYNDFHIQVDQAKMLIRRLMQNPP